MNGGRGGLLSAMVRSSLRFRGVILALACLVSAYGLYSLTLAKYDVFPEFAPPQVNIQTESPGFSPEQVESLVTQPIENALIGVPGIESLRSGSIQGLSSITLYFQPGTDIYRNRQMVSERLGTIAGRLPQGVQAPVMTPLTTSTSTILVIGLTSEKLSLMELRTVADWVIKPRLLAAPGVSKAIVHGGEVRQLQILVRPEKLIQYNLSFNDLLMVASQATGVQGAGFVENSNQRIVLQTEGQSLTPERIGNSVLRQENGANILLGDVAQVAEGPEPPFGAATIMGRQGVQLVISAQYGANTLELTRNVEAALKDLLPTLKAQGIAVYPDLFRPANFIQTAIRNLSFSLLIGAILVMAVLLLFLFNLRTAAISLTAIPLSLLTTALILDRWGFSLNTMTLGGLAIAIGQVVDDAIIDVENILRRLRENRERERPRSAFTVILDASIEVRHPVVYATFAIALVFIPVLTISGVAGRLFSPLGVAFIVAILISLLVALTLTPALCLLLLPHRLPERESPLTAWLKKRYRFGLRRVEKNPRMVIAVVVLLTTAGLATIPFLKGEFLPEFQEGHFIIHMSTVPGTSLMESERLGQHVTRELLQLSFVRFVAQRIGRAERSEDVYGTHYSEIDVDLKPLSGQQVASTSAEVRKKMGRMVGVRSSVKTFLTERIEETISGYTYSVVISIFGSDLDLLDAKAQEISRLLAGIQGAADILVQSPLGAPQLVVRLRKEDIVRWGLDAVQTLNAVAAAYQGAVAGQIYEGNRVFNVVLILAPEERRTLDAVRDLPLRNPAGTYVRLGQVADIYETPGRYIILHEGARRVQTVTCNVVGRNVASFVDEARGKIGRISLPTGTYIAFAGTAEAQARSRRDILVHSLLAAVAIILLLSLVTAHPRNLLLVLVNLPFALVGGVLSVLITGGSLSLGSLVGFVTIFGITLRNSLLMISHFEHLLLTEGKSWDPETAIQGASDRLAPILMTALVTGLGMLPLALSRAAGHEIEGPMALVILGGLVTSTVLNLLVMPTLALRYGRFEKKEEV